MNDEFEVGVFLCDRHADVADASAALDRSTEVDEGSNVLLTSTIVLPFRLDQSYPVTACSDDQMTMSDILSNHETLP